MMEQHINCELDEGLKFHYSYMYPVPEGDYNDCQPCTNEYRTIVYQINSDGSETEVSFNGGIGTFEYSPDGYFLKRD